MKYLRYLLATALAFAGLDLPLHATTVVGTGTAASCTEASLDAAIGEANATFGIVSFDCGAAPHILVVTGEKALANGVIVDGGGKITLSGGNNTRIFNVALGAAVALQDLTLTRGFASHGGCILAHSSPEAPILLSLTRVRFELCKAVNFGGAIAATQANLQIAGGHFQQNRAENGGGGAISLNGGIFAAADTEFSINSTYDQGGALQIWFASVAIARGFFFANNAVASTLADAGGGAMLLRSSGGTVVNTDFQSNYSNSRGGAVHLQDGADLTFEDSRLSGNYSDFGGGGVFVGATARADIRRSDFYVNIANNNGGGLLGLGEVHAQASTFSHNRAADQGCAMYIGNGASLELTSATLFENTRYETLSNPAQLGWGGATMRVHNTLLQSPGSATPACSGPFGNFSFSVWDDNSCPAASGPNNITFMPVALRPRGLSCGGAATELTRSYALAPNSFAIDRGSCRPGDPATDQRGMPRPQGAACDVGATEFFAPCDGPFFSDGFETGTTGRWSLTLG